MTSGFSARCVFERVIAPEKRETCPRLAFSQPGVAPLPLLKTRGGSKSLLLPIFCLAEKLLFWLKSGSLPRKKFLSLGGCSREERSGDPSRILNCEDDLGTGDRFTCRDARNPTESFCETSFTMTLAVDCRRRLPLHCLRFVPLHIASFNCFI